MNFVKFNQSNILNNIKIIKNEMPLNTKFCAVVKANAYGHGIENVVQSTQSYVDYYAVANIAEALAIRKISLSKPIIVLGRLFDFDIKLAIQNNIEITVSNLEHLMQIYKIACQLNLPAYLHIAINTGMNRLGISTKAELIKVENIINCSTLLNLKGIFTHFATPISNKHFFSKQVTKFENLLSIVDKDKYLIHCSSSTAFLLDKRLCYNMVRVGLAMYGYDSTHILNNLKPFLNIYSTVQQIHYLKRGEFCGYDAEFIADKPTKIAVVGIGYGDGVPRKTAKLGYVIINNHKCKIVGKICMDMLFVNATNISCSVGDKVIVMGASQDYSITATDLAKWNDTIEYEVLTNFSLVRV